MHSYVCTVAVGMLALLSYLKNNEGIEYIFIYF